MALTATQIISTICSGLAADPDLEVYLEMAENQTSNTHFGVNRSRAVALRAAHMWSLNSPYRNNGEAGAVQSKTEGRLSLSFSVPGDKLDDLNQTHYGVQLRNLIRSSSPAIRVIGG